MRKTMRYLVFAAFVASAALAAPAAAQWKALENPTSTDDILAACDIVSDLQFFAGGMALDQSSGFPMPKTVFYRTQDGGKLMQPVAVGAGLFPGSIGAIAFRTLTDGWVALGGDVYRTTNGGTFGKVTVDADRTITRLARLGDTHGVAVGKEGGAWRTTDGGTSWTPTDTRTKADLDCVHFIDGQRGWAAGPVPVEVDNPDPDARDATLTTYSDTVVLATTDGGATWTVKATLPKVEADGEGGRTACPIFFLPDGKTGWMVQALHDMDKQKATKVLLLKSTDGGATWADQDVDVEVGKLKFGGFQEMPIHMSYAVGMYWSDDGLFGRVSGSADTGMSGGGGGGGDSPVYKLVDLTTRDGGKSWDKPDYGTITFDFTGGGQAIAGDPRPVQAVFKGWYQALMVGEKGTIWTMGADCTKTSECLPGYECRKPDPDVHARCYPKAEDPDATGGSDTAGDRDAVTGTDGAGEGVSPATDVPACQGDACEPSGKSGGGCAGSGLPIGPGAWPAALLMAAYLAWSRRSRR